MSTLGVILKQPDIAKYQFMPLDFHFSVASGVPTLTPAAYQPVRIVFGTTAAAPLTTAAIDAFTGLTGDIAGDTCFGSTAMGTDSFGFVIDMGGQAAACVSVQALLYLSTPVPAGAAASTSALTNALSTAVACSPLGNLYGRTVITGFDAGTAYMHLRVWCLLK